jgi:hypothetical protein
MQLSSSKQGRSAVCCSIVPHRLPPRNSLESKPGIPVCAKSCGKEDAYGQELLLTMKVPENCPGSIQDFFHISNIKKFMVLPFSSSNEVTVISHIRYTTIPLYNDKKKI